MKEPKSLLEIAKTNEVGETENPVVRLRSFLRIGQTISNSSMLKAYLKTLQNGLFLLGASQQDNTVGMENFFHLPGLLIKSFDKETITSHLKFVITCHLARHDDYKFYIYDNKGNYFPTLYRNKTVSRKSQFELVNHIENMWSLIELRRKEIAEAGYNSVHEHESSTEFKYSKFVFVIPDLEEVLSLLQYDKRFEDRNSAAWKLKNIARMGRTYGFWLMAGTSPHTKITPEVRTLMPGFTTVSTFQGKSLIFVNEYDILGSGQTYSSFHLTDEVVEDLIK